MRGDNSSIDFRVEASLNEYKFYANVDGLRLEAGSLPADLLVRSSPQVSHFIGTHFGLFAVGHQGTASRDWVYSRNAVWEGRRHGGA